MEFADLNWMDVENYLQKDDRLLLVVGACEQHAYLSLLTDVKIPYALAQAAAQQTGILIAPPVNFGISPYFLKYPGTLSLRTSTMLDLIEDIVLSAYGHGFKRIVVLNGHGGNAPLQGRLHELVNRHAGLKIAWYSWWQAASVQALAKASGYTPSHANWLEAFPFTRLVHMPEILKPHVQNREILSAQRFREKYGDGSFGGPYLAPDQLMESIFSAALEDILDLLNFEG